MLIHIMRTAFKGHADEQEPQPTHMDSSCMGKSYGFSWGNALCGQALPAAQIPRSHLSGWHLLKSIDGTGFISISMYSLLMPIIIT